MPCKTPATMEPNTTSTTIPIIQKMRLATKAPKKPKKPTANALVILTGIGPAGDC